MHGTLRWVLLVVCVIGVVGCAIHLLGGIFYLNSAWYYVPPCSALSLIAVVVRPRTARTIAAAYVLAGLFVVSYATENWHLLQQRLADEGFFFFPDGAEALLVLSLLIALHAREKNSSAVT